jgi:hypothetical protein
MAEDGDSRQSDRSAMRQLRSKRTIAVSSKESISPCNGAQKKQPTTGR